MEKGEKLYVVDLESVSLFPPENAVGSFVKIVQRIPVKIVFDEEIKKDEFNIVSGMSVVPKVKVK